MARLSVSEAIRRSGIGRTQFYSKYVNDGLISVSVDSRGKKYIDSTEVLRVFGELHDEQQTDSPEQFTANNPVQPEPNNSAQAEQIAMLKEQLDEAREREKFYQTQIVSLTHRLEPPAKNPNPFARWWRGLGDEPPKQ